MKKILLIILIAFLSTQVSCTAPSNFIEPVSENEESQPDQNDLPRDENSPPVTIAAPPILFLKARGTFMEEDGVFLVEGYVEDEDQNPVSEATVTITNSRTQDENSSETNDDGEFESQIDAEIGDVIVVQAFHPGYDNSNVVELKVVKDYIRIIGSQDVVVIDPELMMQSNQNPRTIRLGNLSPTSWALSADENFLYLVYKEEGVLRVFDLIREEFQDLNEDGFISEDDSIFIGSQAKEIASHPGGGFLYISFDENKIRVLDTDRYHYFDLNNDGIHDENDFILTPRSIREIYFDPNETKAYLLSAMEFNNNRIEVIDLRTHQLSDSIIHPNGLREVSSFKAIHVNEENNLILALVDSYTACNGCPQPRPSELDLVFIDRDNFEIIDSVSLILLINEPEYYLTSDGTYAYVAVSDCEPQFSWETCSSSKKIYIVDLNQRDLVDFDQNGRFDSIEIDDELCSNPIFSENGTQLQALDKKGFLTQMDVQNLEQNFLNENLINDQDKVFLGQGILFNRRFEDESFVYVLDPIFNTLKKLNLNEGFDESYVRRASYGPMNEDFQSLDQVVRSVTSPDQNYTYILNVSSELNGTRGVIRVFDNRSKTYVDTNQDNEINGNDLIFLEGGPSDIAMLNEDELYIAFKEENSIKILDTQAFNFVDLNNDALINEEDQLSLGHIGFDQMKTLEESSLIFVNSWKNIYILDTATRRFIDMNSDGLVDQNDYFVASSDYIVSSDLLHAFVIDNMSFGPFLTALFVVDLLNYERVDLNGDGLIDDVMEVRLDDVQDYILIGATQLLLRPDNEYLYILDKKTFVHESVSLDIIDTSTYERFDRNQDGLHDEEDDIQLGLPIEHNKRSTASMIMSPDGSKIYIYSEEQETESWLGHYRRSSIKVFDTQTNSMIDINRDGLWNENDQIFLGEAPATLGMSFNGDYLYVSEKNRAYIINTWTYEVFIIPYYLENHFDTFYQRVAPN